MALAGNSVSVGAGNSSTCAEFNGGAKCWGLGSSGQLGNGTSGDTAFSDVPVDAILAGSGVSAVAVGVGHACAIANGNVKCWGDNALGQLGDASNVSRITPVDVNLFPAPSFFATPTTLNFSSGVGVASAVQTVTISNPGTASLNLFSFDFSGAFMRAAGTDAGSCATFTLMPPASTCTIGIVFQPSQIGITSGTLSILHNAPGATNVVALNGSGLPPPFAFVGAVSRKVHASAGTFDMPIATGVPITGAVTVEPRMIDTGHTIVFQFNGTVTSPGSVSVAPAGGATTTFAGNEVLVTLTAVPDNQRATITLSNVNGSVSVAPLSMGFLVGDVNNSRSVNSSDISGVKARSGQTTTAANFRFDLNTSGSINSSDISAAKARSGLVLP